MRRRLCFFFLLLPMLAGWAQGQDLRAWGYAVWWYPQGWKAAPLAQFERVLLFQFSAKADGSIQAPPQWPDTWPGLQAQAVQDGVAIDATLSLLDRATFLKIFGCPLCTQRLLDEAVALAHEPGINGLHLDVEVYEAVEATAIGAFRGFVQALQARLHEAGQERNLSVFVPLGKFRGLYDAAQLATMDQVVLQGYDAHWDTSPRAGPVAPLDGPYPLTWRAALRQADQWGLERSRLRMGYPLYGYEWAVKAGGPRAPTRSTGETTSLMPLPDGAVAAIHHSAAAQVLRHGATFDPRSASSYYHYQDTRGGWHEGWFEDGWSLMRKAQFLREQQVGGIAFFPLGYDDGQLLRTIVLSSTDADPH